MNPMNPISPSSKSSKSSKKNSFPKTARILSSAEFSSVIDQGKRFLTKNLVVTSLSKEQGIARLGITISTKISKSSPGRNHFKRAIREAFRKVRSELPACDITVNARQGAHKLSSQELERDLYRCLEKLSLLSGKIHEQEV
jgi:ribonuclease P protein component